MVRLAGEEFDVLERAATAGYLNIGPDAEYTEAVDELMEEFKHYRAEVFKDGKWVNPGSWGMRKVDFGGDVGVKQCASMFFEELGEIPALFPGLRETGFYISGSHWFTDWIITPIVMLGLKIAPHRGMRPLGRLVWWGMTRVPKPPYKVILKVEAEGIKDSQRKSLEISVSHADGYELTAIPVVAMLKQVLDGSARKPGLWMMGHLADPTRLFGDMEQMGVGVKKVFRKTENPEGLS
jgi:saccharopine dehydrogenase (NAD+, L-lysine-forming)